VHNADHQGSDPQLCYDEYYDDKERAELTLNEEEVVRSTAEESWGRTLVMGLKRDGVAKLVEHQCCSSIVTVK
jgi:hypothetical protein